MEVKKSIDLLIGSFANFIAHAVRGPDDFVEGAFFTDCVFFFGTDLDFVFFVAACLGLRRLSQMVYRLSGFAWMLLMIDIIRVIFAEEMDWDLLLRTSGGPTMTSVGDDALKTVRTERGKRERRCGEGRMSRRCLGGDGMESMCRVGEDARF